MNGLTSLVTIDIGNTRIKAGRFDRSDDGVAASLAMPLPIGPAGLWEPTRLCVVDPGPWDAQPDLQPLLDWLEADTPDDADVAIGSVHRGRTALVQALVADRRPGHPARVLTARDMPIAIQTRQPERTGIDRLAAAVAANQVRRSDTGLIVVDFGTAVTVDLVNAEGAFAGGAILPGVALSARALHDRTDALPEVTPGFDGKSPPAIGSDTERAITAGIYWGTIGAVRELIARQTDGLINPPQVVVTGGTSPEVARLLSGPTYTVRFYPHLVLTGLATAHVMGTTP